MDGDDDDVRQGWGRRLVCKLPRERGGTLHDWPPKGDQNRAEKVAGLAEPSPKHKVRLKTAEARDLHLVHFHPRASLTISVIYQQGSRRSTQKVLGNKRRVPPKGEILHRGLFNSYLPLPERSRKDITFETNGLLQVDAVGKRRWGRVAFRVGISPRRRQRIPPPEGRGHSAMADYDA